MSERVGTNDSYYNECSRLADIAIRTERYYASAHQPCITEEQIVDAEEELWSGRNLIHKTLGFHRCEGKNYLSDLKKKRDELSLSTTNINFCELKIELIDTQLYMFQCSEREACFRDRWTRWSYHCEDFQLEFGHRPIVENWAKLKNQALKFIEDIL